MRILYLHQYFMTRQGIGGTRSYEFARYLVNQGHEVVMVAASDKSNSAGSSGVNRRLVDGIELIEVPAGHHDYLRGTSMGYIARIRSFLQFAVASTRVVLKMTRPDLGSRQASDTKRPSYSKFAISGRRRQSSLARLETSWQSNWRAGSKEQSIVMPLTLSLSRQACAMALSPPGHPANECR
jgi:hypothetical protein